MWNGNCPVAQQTQPTKASVGNFCLFTLTFLLSLKCCVSFCVSLCRIRRPQPLWMLPLLSPGSQVDSRDTCCLQWTAYCCSPVSYVSLRVRYVHLKEALRDVSAVFCFTDHYATKSGSLTSYLSLNSFSQQFARGGGGWWGGYFSSRASEPLTTRVATPLHAQLTLANHFCIQ